MKRFFCFLLCAMFFILCFPFSAVIAEGEILSGVATVSFSGADLMKINGVEYASADNGFDFDIIITVSGCEDKENTVYLNGISLGCMVDGENIFSVNTSKLVDGENSISIKLSNGTDVYDETDVYGSFNLDDIVVKSVVFEGFVISAPTDVDLFLPVVGAAGNTVSRIAYKTDISMGDGWFADTGLGGSTPNTPVSTSFVFQKPDLSGMFSFDSSALADGTYKAEFFAAGKSLGTKDISVDNNSPDVVFSVENNARVESNSIIAYSVTDANTCDISLTVDGKKAIKIDCSRLSVGPHTATVTAVDAVGFTTVKTLLFDVVDSTKLDVTVGEKTVTMTAYEDAKIYGAQLLTDIRMFHNRIGEFDMKSLRCEDEVQLSFDDKAEIVTSAVGNTLPYQSFVVNTRDAKDNKVLVSYTGTTGNGADIVLKAWNYDTKSWHTIAKTKSGVPVTVEMSLEGYSKSDKMRINAMPYLLTNGSDTVFWNSDTQYYSRYEDLNDVYYRINEYAVELYNKGEIGYYVHTGDLIDQTTVGDETALKEYAVADKAQKILEDAKVPHGIVSGNHDIKHTTADYSYYWKFFGEERYKDFEWYGGSLNNNMHHYDLVTIGAYDFVFLYLGCYMEDNAETVAWANAVCKAYPERNVIICTHEYMSASGVYLSERSTNIWDRIVVPNENVKMILCGHYEGVCDQLHQVEGTDRYVLEILADYQFAEMGVDPQHVENGCTCDGEGFVRLMSFTESGQLVSTTYSPTNDVYNFFPSYQDSFVYDLDLIPADRSICTTDFNVAYNTKYLGEFGKEEIDLSHYGAFYATFGEGDSVDISAVYVLDKYKTGDKTANDPHNYTTEFPRVSAGGLTNVSENFVRPDRGDKLDLSLVENGQNLLPSNNSQLIWSSGSKDYTNTVNADGSLTVKHESGNNATWLTQMFYLNKSIDLQKYNRLYFGVTTSKDTKWNLYINFPTKSINFSQELYEMFGYVNAVPSDIQGSWQGYIDLTDLVPNETKILSVYLVTATPGADVTFDYYFLGHSDAGKVRFITDENTVTARENNVGQTINAPADPYKTGYTFDGWYTAKDGGEKISFPMTINSASTDVYARFVKNEQTTGARYIDTEILMERAPISKIILIVGSILCVIFMTTFLLVKKAKSKPKKAEK